MATNVSLSSAVRDSLLSLQGTTDLINRTQARLSSGLKVSGAVDDPVAYFQSKSLTDRAADFTSKKEGIDQAISTVSAALDGVTGVESLVAQMKGIAQSMKSATGTQFTDLIQQFNDLRSQINHLTTDSTYQGVNLINGSGVSLDVEFSKLTASVLNIASVDVTNGSNGLNIGAIDDDTGGFYVYNNVGTVGSAFTAGETFTLNYEGVNKTYAAGTTVSYVFGSNTLTLVVGTTDVVMAPGDTITVTAQSTGDTGNAWYVDVGVPDTGGFYVSYAAGTVGSEFTAGDVAAGFTYEGNDATYAAGDTVTFTYGSTVLTVVAGSGGVTLANGTTFSIQAYSAATLNTGGFYVNVAGGFTIAGSGAEVAAETAAVIPDALVAVAAAGAEVAVGTTSGFTYVLEGQTTEISTLITNLDAALDTTRSQATKLGTNVSLLQTRLDFTTNYVNTLESGSGKLTLADINQEGANLLALQTRQQLGVNSLAFAGQAEQSILSLFR